MGLSWNNENKENIEFPIHYWKNIINTYEQYVQGDHSVTKAFQDYLGFADDYDFCWGPENEGDKLEGPEYNQRLWGVYARTEGEIYLLKSNADLTGWEREEFLAFAPTGSQYPAIDFNEDGHFEIAVEFTPAGLNIPEIWMLSYPYSGEKIRKICTGRKPRLFVEHNKDIMLFYTGLDEFKIHYRLMSEDYAVEHTVDSIYIPERKLNLVKAYKVFENLGDNELSSIIKEIVFYTRADDIYPLKYVMHKTVNPTEKNDLNLVLGSLYWEDISTIVNLHIYSLLSGTNADNAKVIVYPQKAQNEVITFTSSDGNTKINLIPYDTVYDIELEHPEFGVEKSISILIDEQLGREISIVAPFLHGLNKPEDSLSAVATINNIEFELATYDINLTVYDSSGNPLEGATVTFHGQNEQEDVVVVTGSEGNAVLELLPYETPYSVTIEHHSEGTETGLSVLVFNHDETFEMDIILFYFDKPSESIGIGNYELSNIEWEDITYELEILLYDLNSNPIVGADITFVGQLFQDTKTVTTDGNGYAYIESIIPYQSLYEVIIELADYSETHFVKIYDEPDRHMEVNMHLLVDSNKKSDDMSFGNDIQSILWVEV